MWVLKGLSMEKWLCWGSMLIASVLFLLFLLDLITGIPFDWLSPTVDVVGLVACLIVVYLSWDAFKDLL